MDAVAEPLNEEVVVMKSAQVGWTEIIGNIVGYFVDQDPASILVVQPTLDMAEAWSKDRLAPMVRDTKCLTAKIADAKARDSGNTVLHKKFPGGQLTIAGANSPASLASRPIRVVLADEVGRYPASAGTEGDPLTLAYKRANNFWNRRKLAGSTPGIAGVCRIEAKFLESDQRRYFVPCPHCGEAQVLRWDQVRWDKTKAGAHRPETAHYVCIHNGCIWDDGDRGEAVRLAPHRGGGWRATAPFKGIAGFHIWEAYSPWVKLADTVKAFLEAKKSPETYKVWTNTALGETWVEKGEAPDWQRLYDRRESEMVLGTPPAWAGLLVGSCDLQRANGGRIEADIWAFGPRRQRALVEHVEIEGDLASAVTWAKLDTVVAREWVTTDGRSLRLTRVGVDTGDGETTMHARAWCRRHSGLAMALKGRQSVEAMQPIAGPTWIDLTIGGKKIQKGVRQWTVGTSMLKSELFGDLRLERPIDGQEYPDGYVFLAGDVTDEWIKQLVAEQLIAKRNKRTGRTRQEWQLTRPRNEALDNAIYARAIAISLGIDRWTDVKWQRLLGPGKGDRAAARSRRRANETAPAEQAADIPSGGKKTRKVNPLTGRSRGSFLKGR